MSFEDVLVTFIDESRQLLREMEESLLQLEQNQNDPDLLNAIFRAAHTIKGSAGLFGLETIVSFTHNAESVLDLMRSGTIVFHEELVALLLRVCDHITALINAAAVKQDPPASLLEQGEELTKLLKAYLDTENQEASADALPSTCSKENGCGITTTPSASELWHISIRFGPEVMRNGMDPMSILRYLNTFGKIEELATITGAIPNSSEMDPEVCYIGFEFSYRYDGEQKNIEEAFEFIREDSRLTILAPHSPLDHYQQLLASLSEERQYLEQVFQLCGSLTAEEVLSLSDVGPEENSAEAESGKAITLAEDNSSSVKATVSANKPKENTLIRVDANKLDSLINLIGELVISGAGLNLLARSAGRPDLMEATGNLARLVEEVRGSALNLRMVEIGDTFNKFQRVVRDVSKELGKDIRLKISGGETELDKTVVEKIGDPLTHLVRNSMDHGIEPEEVRIAKGKPAQGTVRLNAYHDSGSIVIEVSDDGAGLRKDKILAKAKEKGLVPEDAILCDRDIYNLIFEPGFSTADKISNLSGRGVGMDVVKRNIQALRGSIEVENEEGQGATMRIRLPLTLAIIDGFLIGIGNSSYVLPLDMVVECLELSSDSEELNHGHNYLNLRGEVLPFIRLRELFGTDAPPARRQNVVVVKYAEKRIGIVVDYLFGEFQTVIKPLGSLFSHLKAISGFTILGGGEVALILDIPGIARQLTAPKLRAPSAVLQKQETSTVAYQHQS